MVVCACSMQAQAIFAGVVVASICGLHPVRPITPAVPVGRVPHPPAMSRAALYTEREAVDFRDGVEDSRWQPDLVAAVTPCGGVVLSSRLGRELNFEEVFNRWPDVGPLGGPESFDVPFEKPF